MLTISVVIPVYRAEQTLSDLYRQLSDAMSKVTPVFEIIFIEDGGGDGSWPIIERLACTDHRVRGIRMSRNYGQHNALLCGIRAAKHEIILTMDDDLQHPVSEIGPMLAALTPEYDVVYGAPQEEQHGLLRDLLWQQHKIALANYGRQTARNVSAFRVFRTRLREGFKEYRSPSVSIDVLLTWTTKRFTAIKVRHEARSRGVSGYTPGKLIRHAVNLMTGFSTLPLQIASVVGFVFVFFGFCADVCASQLCDSRWLGTRIHVSRFSDCYILGGAAFRTWGFRRIPRPHAFPQHGSTALSGRRNVRFVRAGRNRRRIRFASCSGGWNCLVISKRVATESSLSAENEPHEDPHSIQHRKSHTSSAPGYLCRPSRCRRSCQQRWTIHPARAGADAGALRRATYIADHFLHRCAGDGGAAMRLRSRRRGDSSILYLRFHRKRCCAAGRHAGVRGYPAGHA